MSEKGWDFSHGCEGCKQNGAVGKIRRIFTVNTKARTYKKRTPPREKKVLVVSGTRKNTVPIMIACMMKVL